MMMGRCGVVFTLMLLAVCLGLVDCIFARFACMWPLMVGTRFGGQRRSCLVVMLGNVVRYPALIALASVLSVGEKRDL